METRNPLSITFERLERYWLQCGPWRWDGLALVFACALFATDIAILASYNGTSLSDWHVNISLNTIISTISTVAMFTLMNPLGAAVGQCKWLLFRRKNRPLPCLSYLDGASRGPYGSIKLFGRRKTYGVLPAVGALLMIVSLAVNPSMQQLIRYRFRDLELGTASIPIAYDYGSVGVGGFLAANVTMKAAAYGGFFNPLDFAFNVTSNCPSGNCTWPPFQSLGVCSSCEDLTRQIERKPIEPNYFNGGGPSNFALPNGFNMTTKETLNDSGLTYMNISTTARMYSNSYHTIDDFTFNNLSIAFADRGSLVIDLFALRLRGMSNSGDNVTLAQDCVLQYCVKTISAVQRNGELVETVLSTWTNNSEAARKFYLGYLQSDPNAWESLYFLQPPGQERVFRVGHAPQVQMTSWLDRQLVGTASRQPPNSVQVFSSDQIQGIDTAFNHGESGLQDVLNNVAQAMTAALRTSSEETAPGVMLVSEPYIHIQWAWITFPIILYVLTACFVATVALQGRVGDGTTHVWKNSIVAALCHGLDDKLSGKLASFNTQNEIDDATKDVEVRLAANVHGMQLICEEPRELVQWQPEVDGAQTGGQHD